MATRPPKPTEIRLVAGLLREEWASPEDAANAIIRALDERRAEHDKDWVIIRPNAGLIYGPYPTQTAARKAAAKGVSIYKDQTETAQLARLFSTIEAAGL